MIFNLTVPDKERPKNVYAYMEDREDCSHKDRSAFGVFLEES